ncbi:hypothetical protein DN069_30105 [Streptacidiphilus pinicola]|uniref:Uncharacterized protein n=1 Tax=Streptacidiphilus pinicola TaxID=2219663 RepID=A0A2X0IEC2_9ACTN|nr:hypothetical protein DN069_30105 [Streptacidiphilus pinicola]
MTDTAPSAPLTVVPGAPEPRLALTGADIDNAPDVTLNVVVVSGSAPLVAAAGLRCVVSRPRP